MSKLAKIIIAIILAALVILLLWYMLPRTLDSVLDLDGKTVTSMTVTGMFIEDSRNADGAYRAVHRSFQIGHESADPDAILELLRTTRYSRSPRSLLSPKRVGLSGDGGVISISMVLDGKEPVTMTVSGLVTFGLPGRSGLTVARANESLFPLLEEYIRENGVE